MRNFEYKFKDSRISLIVKLMKAVMLFVVFFTLFDKFAIVDASEEISTAGSQVSYQLNYVEEIAVVTAGTGSSIKFYMSTDKMKTWEMIDASGVVDISTLLLSRENIIYFKGNKQTNPVEVKLPAEDSSLKVTYEIVNGVGKISFTNADSVEYRRGANGVWKTATNQMSTAIYEIKGATLYFRTPATAAKRAGKIVTVKIGKRPVAPSVKLDASKLSITGLKVGETQYRVGDATEWTTFSSLETSVKYITLQALLASTASSNTPIPAGVIEFRTIGTNKKLTSAIKVVEVPQQPMVPEAITLTGTTLSIIDTDTRRAYEYTKVENGKTFNLDTARWTTVTSARTTVISKAAVGDKILVRLKSKTDTTSKQLIPASTYKEFVVLSITVK